MSENVRPEAGPQPPAKARKAELAAAKARAAVLLAEDELTDLAIAEACGVSDRQLRRWKAEPAFADRVKHDAAAIAAGMRRLAIAKRHKRVKVLDELHAKALAVVEARAGYYRELQAQDAAEPAIAAMRNLLGQATAPPGAETGLLVRQVKAVGGGKSGQLLEEFAVDVATLREIRALEEQAARELGQWSEKHEIAGAGGGPIRVTAIRDHAPVGDEA